MFVNCRIFTRTLYFKNLLLTASVSDPDRIRIQSGQWIRIQEGKNDPEKKGKKF
jgi:hypothetical protein